MKTNNQAILLRRWNNLRKNKESMERLILELMENPATEPEHLAQAHALYAGITKQISEISHHVSNVLRTGKIIPDADPVPLTAADIALPTIEKAQKSEAWCVCGCTEPPMKPIDHPSVYESCPNCGMV